MTYKHSAVIATGTAALLLFGGCGSDDPTNLASGEAIELVGDDQLGGETLDIHAEDDDGEVTGEIRFSTMGGGIAVSLECASTGDDGLLMLGGTVDPESEEIPGLVALLVKEGDPDSVALWFDEPPPANAESCDDLLDSIPVDDLTANEQFVAVETGSDIETG